MQDQTRQNAAKLQDRGDYAVGHSRERVASHLASLSSPKGLHGVHLLTQRHGDFPFTHSATSTLGESLFGAEM